MSKKLELSRRRLIGGLGTIGLASAGAGLGTSAYFNDTESFDGNSLDAGELDLYLHYEFSFDQGSDSGNFNGPTSGTIQGDQDEGATVSYNLSNVEPGDRGNLGFSVSLVDNPGYLWMSGDIAADSENTITEPEGETPWERDGSASGELAKFTRASLYYEDGSGSKTEITRGSLLGLLSDLKKGMPLHGDGNPDSGVIERPTFDAGSDPTSPTDDTYVGLYWWVPTWVGNEIQADSIEFDISCYAEQARHNDGSGDWTVVDPSDDLQTAIDDAASGDTLLLASGTHTGEVTVDKTLNVRGEGPSNTIHEAPDSARGIKVESDGVRIGDLTVQNAGQNTSGGQAIDVNGQATGSGRVANVMLCNIVATNNGDRGVVLDYTDNAIVRDLETTNNGNDGLTLWYTNDSHVESVVANDNGDNGIYSNGDNNVILDSEAKRNVDEGVDINWYDDLGSSEQRVTLDDVVAMDNGQEDIELHDNGTDDSVAADSMLLRKVETGGAPTGLRMVQVAESEVHTDQVSFPNGSLDGNDNDVDP